MPILDIQRRLREAGRIRLGTSVAAQTRDGKAYRRPKKIDVFRFTSQDQAVLDQAAELYGGTVEAWEGHDGYFDLVSEARSIPCLLPPTALAFSQWWEAWEGGLCIRRCDGQRDQLTDRPCLCDPEDRLCKPTTRLSVMLTDLPGSGTWRLESHGYNAAAELEGTVALLQAAQAGARLIPAKLMVEKRSGVYRGKDGKPETRRFVVPALEIDQNLFTGPALTAGEGHGLAALEAPLPQNPVPGLTPIAPANLDAAIPPVRDQITQTHAPRRTSTPPVPRTGVAPRTAADRASGTPAAVDARAPRAGESRPSPAPGPSHDEAARGRAQRVAIWCKEAGIETDDERHGFLLALFDGRIWSAKSVGPDDLETVRRATRQIMAGQIRLERRTQEGADDTWVLTNPTLGIETTRAGLDDPQIDDDEVLEAELVDEPGDAGE